MQKRSNKKRNLIYSIIDSSEEETIINVFGIDGLFFGFTENEALSRAIDWIASEERIEEKNIFLSKHPLNE